MLLLTPQVEALTLHPDFPADSKGIPKFWLHVLKNANEEALYGLVGEDVKRSTFWISGDCLDLWDQFNRT